MNITAWLFFGGVGAMAVGAVAIVIACEVRAAREWLDLIRAQEKQVEEWRRRLLDEEFMVNSQEVNPWR